MKVFLDRYYNIHRACPICADVRDNMIFSEEDKYWFIQEAIIT